MYSGVLSVEGSGVYFIHHIVEGEVIGCVVDGDFAEFFEVKFHFSLDTLEGFVVQDDGVAGFDHAEEGLGFALGLVVELLVDISGDQEVHEVLGSSLHVLSVLT